MWRPTLEIDAPLRSPDWKVTRGGKFLETHHTNLQEMMAFEKQVMRHKLTGGKQIYERFRLCCNQRPIVVRHRQIPVRQGPLDLYDFFSAVSFFFSSRSQKILAISSASFICEWAQKALGVAGCSRY